MKSKYFDISEVIPKILFYQYKDKGWKFIDTKLIETIDNIKETFSTGEIYINTYKNNGKDQWNGLRVPECPFYSIHSLHSYGKAVNMTFLDYTIEEVRSHIILNPDKFPYIKGIGMGSHLHIDVRNQDKVQIFDNKGRVYQIAEALALS